MGSGRSSEKRGSRRGCGCLLLLLATGLAVALLLVAVPEGEAPTDFVSMLLLEESPPLAPDAQVPWTTRQDSPLDATVQRACGPEPGGEFSQEEASELLLSWELRDAGVDGPRAERAWTPRALTHVFCGDFHDDHLGGLHWAGRWEQLYGEWIVIDDECGGHNGPVVQRALRYRTPAGHVGTTCEVKKSVAPDLTVEELLAAGVAGYRKGQTCTTSSRTGHPLLVVVKGGSLTTLYPSSDDDIPTCTW